MTAYERHLARQQSREDAAREREGYAVWFDEAVPPGAGPALDYGAGRGQGVAYLRARGYAPVEALEPDPSLAAALEGVADAVHAGPDPQALLRAQAGRYRLVLAKDVLEHLERAEAVATTRALLEALAPDGRLVVSVPHAVSFVGVYVRYGDYTHVTAFTAGSLRYLLEAAGARDVRLHAPRFRLRLDPRALAYRALKRAWHLALRGIYYLETPSRDALPPHFHPRLVASARPPGAPG